MSGMALFVVVDFTMMNDAVYPMFSLVFMSCGFHSWDRIEIAKGVR